MKTTEVIRTLDKEETAEDYIDGQSHQPKRYGGLVERKKVKSNESTKNSRKREWVKRNVMRSKYWRPMKHQSPI